MAKNNHFYYDEESCEFVPLKYNRTKNLIHSISFWLINGFVFAIFALSVLTKTIGTPAEIALKDENRALVKHLKETDKTLNDMQKQLEFIAEMDNEMYRTIVGMDPVTEERRLAGTGGADIYADYDYHSKDASEILRSTASKLDQLERKMNVQVLSFEEIKSYYNSNQDRLRNIPAIKPVNGILLSGYGMRLHPVLRYKRMHEGVDFRADINTEVYATGDGVVRFASRNGSYGNLLEIDHGFGMVTRYAHLSSFVKGVRPGKRVQRGELVAYTGNTGLTEGPHLHYEVLVDGKPIDPLTYLIADISPEEYLMFKRTIENEENEFSISLMN